DVEDVGTVATGNCGKNAVVEVSPADDFQLYLYSGLFGKTIQRGLQLGCGVVQAVALVRCPVGDGVAACLWAATAATAGAETQCQGCRRGNRRWDFQGILHAAPVFSSPSWCWPKLG